MFMSPVISGSTRTNNESFGLMPLNALNGSESTFPGSNDICSTVLPSYEESVICGSLAFDTQRDSRQPSPSTPRSRKGDNSPRNFRMSPTPSRVAPADFCSEDIMTRLENEQNLEMSNRDSLFIPHIHTEKLEEDDIISNLHRRNSDPPPAYEEVMHLTRDDTSCPSFHRGQTMSPGSENISIISTSGVNGMVLSEIEQNAELASSKSQKRKRMRHVTCGCVIVLLTVAITVALVLMTSGSFMSHNEAEGSGETTTTTFSP